MVYKLIHITRWGCEPMISTYYATQYAPLGRAELVTSLYPVRLLAQLMIVWVFGVCEYEIYQNGLIILCVFSMTKPAGANINRTRFVCCPLDWEIRQIRANGRDCRCKYTRIVLNSNGGTNPVRLMHAHIWRRCVWRFALWLRPMTVNSHYFRSLVTLEYRMLK